MQGKGGREAGGEEVRQEGREEGRASAIDPRLHYRLLTLCPAAYCALAYTIAY
jgi:hypothetical protein